jgi:hypothetical protein
MARNGELSLDEMLKADIVRILMRRDGVTEGEIRAVMRQRSSSAKRGSAKKTP